MSRNKYRLHILVLPEDDANRQIANGFLLNPNINSGAIQVLPPAGGWEYVVDKFMQDYASEMQNLPERRMVLLIDFDRQLERRLSDVRSRIPANITDRVFVLGVLSEPEDLKRNMKSRISLERIGENLAQGCPENTNELWNHDLLIHNRIELERMSISVRSFLFPSN
jgi:hypothetical protein